MNKWLEILIGLLILIGVILFGWKSVEWGSFWNFRHAAWEFLKGGVIWMVALVGFVLVILGINDLRD
jgi:hypothetical protein